MIVNLDVVVVREWCGCWCAHCALSTAQEYDLVVFDTSSCLPVARWRTRVCERCETVEEVHA